MLYVYIDIEIMTEKKEEKKKTLVVSLSIAF